MNIHIKPKMDEADIDAIAAYIASDNPKAAIQFIEKLYDAFALLADNPLLGHSRLEVTPSPVRFWVFKRRYLVIYQPENPLAIVRVVSGYQDIAALLEQTMQ